MVGNDISGDSFSLRKFLNTKQGLSTAIGHTFVCSDNTTQGKIGVGVWINESKSGTIIDYEPVNGKQLNRVVRLNAKPRCISMIQVYAPTSVHESPDGKMKNQIYYIGIIHEMEFLHQQL